MPGLLVGGGLVELSFVARIPGLLLDVGWLLGSLVSCFLFLYTI
jgi:hypothetical protein